MERIYGIHMSHKVKTNKLASHQSYEAQSQRLCCYEHIELEAATAIPLKEICFSNYKNLKNHTHFLECAIQNKIGSKAKSLARFGPIIVTYSAAKKEQLACK